MKKISKSLWTILFIIVISLLSAIPVFAENKDSEIMRDSYAYQDGVIYLEETETYRIAFTVHHDGRVTYSVCYKNNSGVVYSGEYFIQNTRSAETFPEIVDILLSLEPTKVTDFTSRPVSKGTITSADKAVDFCASYAPGWRTPVDFEWLGTQSSGGITVIVYESVNGYGEEKVYLNYDVGTLIESLITLLDGFNIEAIIDIVTVGVNGTGDLVAQVGGIITHSPVYAGHWRRNADGAEILLLVNAADEPVKCKVECSLPDGVYKLGKRNVSVRRGVFRCTLPACSISDIRI